VTDKVGCEAVRIPPEEDFVDMLNNTLGKVAETIFTVAIREYGGRSL
jgi:hypothetical protein